MKARYLTRMFVFGATVGVVPAAGQQLSSQTFENLAFRDIGPVNMSGRIVDIAVVESLPFTFYVASATGDERLAGPADSRSAIAAGVSQRLGGKASAASGGGAEYRILNIQS